MKKPEITNDEVAARLQSFALDALKAICDHQNTIRPVEADSPDTTTAFQSIATAAYARKLIKSYLNPETGESTYSVDLSPTPCALHINPESYLYKVVYENQFASEVDWQKGVDAADCLWQAALNARIHEASSLVWDGYQVDIDPEELGHTTDFLKLMARECTRTSGYVRALEAIGAWDEYSEDYSKTPRNLFADADSAYVGEYCGTSDFAREHFVDEGCPEELADYVNWDDVWDDLLSDEFMEDPERNQIYTR